MARQKGSANFAGTLEVLAGGPIDARSVVPTLADLTVASNLPYPYVGLETYVVSENKKYRLIGNDVTQSSNWEEVGSGDTSVFIESSTKTTSSGIDTFSFSDQGITTTAAYDFYADVYGVAPTDVVVSPGSMFVRFNSTDNVTKCRVYIKE